MADVLSPRKIIIIAGPNGAGKTTFAGEFLPHEAGCPMFVNADLIAFKLAPFAPDTVALKAGRMMLTEIYAHVRGGQSFAFETTLSGRRYARSIPQWQETGYQVKLVFLKLASPAVAVERVKRRARGGGHDVPQAVILRRYDAGLHNLEAVYKPLADKWAIYDNSGPNPLLLDEGGKP